MIFALAKLSSVIPGFNSRTQTETDFFSLAEKEFITVAFDDMPILQGFCVRAMRQDYIFLDYRLKGVELVFTAFHELSHVFLHAPRTKRTTAMFYSLARPSKEDAEADAGALICLYPVTEIETLPYRLLHADTFEAQMIKKRLAIYKQFGV